MTTAHVRTPASIQPLPPRDAEGGPPRLILFPGLGADERLFAPQRARYAARLTVPSWPKPLALEGLLEYAGRWALEASAGRVKGVSLTPPYFIGGVSFGGMFALSAATHLSPAPAGVFLIASARNRHALPARTRWAHAAGSHWPAPIARAMIRSLVGLFARRERLTPEHESLLRAMVADVDLPLLLWHARACLRWRFEDRSVRASSGGLVPIHQIHASRDWILPLVKGDPDEVIPGAGHLINLTHADQVHRFLDLRMADAPRFSDRSPAPKAAPGA
jgi:hypothetical protein